LISAAIAFALLASLFLMLACPPQLLALPIPLTIAFPVHVPVPVAVAAAVDVYASRSNLDLLRKSRNGRKKRGRGGNGECISVHGKFSRLRMDRIGALFPADFSLAAKPNKKYLEREAPVRLSRFSRHPR
jgi:hypothetical protein